MSEQAVIILSQSVAALIEAMGMVAENKQREVSGESPAYGEQQFMQVIKKYDLDYHTICKSLYI